MTETTTAPRVYLKYAHPTGQYDGASGCEVYGWYASASAEDPSILQNELDSKCFWCAAPGQLIRKEYVNKEDGPIGCGVLAPGVDPELILPGMPLMLTSRGYKPTG